MRRRPSRLPVVFAVALAVLASPARGGRSDRAAVTETFAAFVRALAARDADAGLRLVSAASVLEWERLRRLALRAPRREVEALPPGHRLAVFALRHGAPSFIRGDASAREQLAAALRAGLAEPKLAELLDIGDVVVRAPRASARVYVSGLPSPLRAGFVREGEAWKLDLPSTLEHAGRFVARSAAEAGTSDDAIIAGLLLFASKERPTARVYEPLEAPAR